MNREQAKALLPIITAYADGKTIQSRFISLDGCIKWDDLTDPTFLYPPSTYRIKPEPIECWVNVYKDGSLGRAWTTKEEAERGTRLDALQVRMREVLE